MKSKPPYYLQNRAATSFDVCLNNRQRFTIVNILCYDRTKQATECKLTDTTERYSRSSHCDISSSSRSDQLIYLELVLVLVAYIHAGVLPA